MYGKPGVMLGKKQSEEFKEKLSKAKRNKVKQLTIDGKFLCEYDSPKHASIILNISLSGIHNCLSPNQPSKSSGGFKWEWV